MGTNSVELKGLGELLDEAVTLCLKYTHTKNKAHIERANDIMNHIRGRTGSDNQTVLGFVLLLQLMIVNSGCWSAQDKIMEEKEPKKTAEWAKAAQNLNKIRNFLIGIMNDNGNGIVTEKTY